MPKDQLQEIARKDPSLPGKWMKMEREDGILLYPQQGMLFRTGLGIAIEPGHACFFWDRSGMGAFKETHRLAGVIDEDYRGEWLVKLFNHSGNIVKIKPEEKIIQGVFAPRYEADFPLVDDLPAVGEAERGLKGFGDSQNT